MGFTKLAQKERGSKFVPSTRDDLKEYAKRGKARRADKEDAKSARKGGPKLLRGEGRSAEYRAMFERHDRFEIARRDVWRLYLEYLKETEQAVPRYHGHLSRKDADGRFVFDVNATLAKMSWIQLSRLVQTAVRSPVVTREYTEAFNFAFHAVVRLTLGVDDSTTTYKLTDLEVLDEFSVKVLKRSTKEDREMSKKEAAEVAKGKAKAKGRDDEDEDEDADESEDEDSEDEDSEDEDADEADDSEEEDEEDEDADEVDEEEEAVKTKKAKKEKAAKKERERPAKMKLKGPIPKAKPVKVKAAKTAKEKPVKKAAKEKAAKVSLGPNSVLAKVKDRPRSGPKTVVLNLMPKKGIKLSDLEKAAKEEGIVTAKVKRFAAMMVKRGFARVVE